MRKSWILAANLAIFAALAGCAGSPARPSLSAPMTPNPTMAVISAVRDRAIGPRDGAAQGVNAVLSGLSQPPLRAPATSSEVVFVKQDGNAGSLVTPPAGQAGLVPGAHVAVISAATTSLVLQN